jgi:hypothetical protein
MAIAGNDLLSQIENSGEFGAKLGQFLRQYVLPSIQQTAQNAAVSPVSQIPAPAPPESVSVNVEGELMQVVVNHTAPVQKGARHIIHVAINPQFTDAMIHDAGASRCPPPFNLPTKDAGGNVQNYYVAAQVQYPGSPPSAATFYGGKTPAVVNMGGTTEMTLLPGTGSGTAANGGQALVGLGVSQVRLAAGPKRNVSG